MKLSELDAIRHLLPDDLEISILSGIDPDPSTVGPKSISTLIQEHWGNHDGRYNMKCTKCGWTSNDIHRGEYEPSSCPKCGKI